MIHRLLSPGGFSAKAVFTVSSLLMTMIFTLDILAPTNIRLHVLYIFPLALIALHCDRRSMLIAGFVLSTIFQLLTFFIDGISSVALATDIVIAFLASALTIFLGMAAQQREALKLASTITSLRLLSAGSEARLATERKQIAAELHDELGQLLTALRIKISLLEMDYGKSVPGLIEQTEKMLGLLDRAVTSMRGVVTHLRPVALDMGLVPALEWLRDDFVRMFHIPCELVCSENIPELNELQLMTVFRIAQELLTNIAKHANASMVHIRLTSDAYALQLSVQDNGVGFLPETSRVVQCFGLLGMRERLLALDGELLIDSALGKGCRVTLNIPIGNIHHD